jgi:hypothetical protein
MVVWIESNFMARLIPWDIKKFKEIRKKLDENNVYFKFI